MKLVTMLAIMMLMIIVAFGQSKKKRADTLKKAPPFVKELPGDSPKHKMPILIPDTSKNNMPIVKPDTTKVKPK